MSRNSPGPQALVDALPFSHRIAVQTLPRTGQTTVLKATEPQMLAIAAFLDIPSVENLKAKILVAPSRGGSFRVTGLVEASVHQLCVVSLEAFPTEIREEIDVRFAPPDRLEAISKAEVERGLHDEDPPELLVDNGIDIGELAVEALALGLDPYPRKPGVETPRLGDNDANESPFAALAALKKPSGS